MASLTAEAHIPSVLPSRNNSKAFSHWVVNQKQQNTKSLMYGEPARGGAFAKEAKEGMTEEDVPAMFSLARRETSPTCWLLEDQGTYGDCYSAARYWSVSAMRSDCQEKLKVDIAFCSIP